MLVPSQQAAQLLLRLMMQVECEYVLHLLQTQHMQAGQVADWGQIQEEVHLVHRLRDCKKGGLQKDQHCQALIPWTSNCHGSVLIVAVRWVSLQMWCHPPVNAAREGAVAAWDP